MVAGEKASKEKQEGLSQRSGAKQVEEAEWSGPEWKGNGP